MRTNLAPNVQIIPAFHEQIEKELHLEPQKLRVAAYARVSTEQDEQQNSYEAQVKYYTNYIQNHPGWEFVSVFAEMKIAYLIQSVRIEYQKKGRNKGFRHIQSDRKPLFFCGP